MIQNGLKFCQWCLHTSREQIISSVLIFTTMEGNLGLITSSIATSLFTIMLVALDLLPDVASKGRFSCGGLVDRCLNLFHDAWKYDILKRHSVVQDMFRLV